MDEEYGNDLVQAYICIIKSLLSCSEDKEGHPDLSRFHAVKLPQISIDDYIVRINKYFQCSYECFVCSLVYIEMLLQNDAFILNDYSIHRIVLTTIMSAAKFYDDSFYNNEIYARIGGVLPEELNNLELEFMFLINFTLTISQEEFYRYYGELYSHCDSICSSCSHLHIPFLENTSMDTLAYSNTKISNMKRRRD